MKYKFFLIIISTFIIFYIINRLMNYKENFMDANPVGFCIHSPSKSLGLRLFNGIGYECVAMNDSKSNKVTSNKQFGKDSAEGRLTGYSSVEAQKAAQERAAAKESERLAEEAKANKYKNEDACLPNNSDFGKICKIRHNSYEYGVNNVTKCDDNTSKVKCGKLIFNGQDYSNNGKYVFATDCLDKSFDFDTICNQYIPSNIKSSSKYNGYDNNSAGVDTFLKGKYGDCFLSDGQSNPGKARAICNMKSNKEISRIRPFSSNIDYNVYTDCHSDSHDFVSDCSKRLNGDQAFADIQGFDCMPGYSRARCINKQELNNIEDDMLKLKFDSKSSLLSSRYKSGNNIDNFESSDNILTIKKYQKNLKNIQNKTISELKNTKNLAKSSVDKLNSDTKKLFQI